MIHSTATLPPPTTWVTCLIRKLRARKVKLFIQVLTVRQWQRDVAYEFFLEFIPLYNTSFKHICTSKMRILIPQS